MRHRNSSSRVSFGSPLSLYLSLGSDFSSHVHVTPYLNFKMCGPYTMVLPISTVPGGDWNISSFEKNIGTGRLSKPLGSQLINAQVK